LIIKQDQDFIVVLGILPKLGCGESMVDNCLDTITMYATRATQL
jgi:hypothetical protein